MKKFFSLGFAFAFCLTMLMANTALAQKDVNADLANSNDLPTNITAERMRYDAAKQQIVFEGSVKVRRPDFDLDSDKLTILFKQNKNTPAATQETNDDPLSTMGTGDIERLVAEGKVTMLRDGRKGTCGKITYHVDKELIVMEQNPVLSEGSNTVSGQVINFYVRENRSEVTGSANAPVKVHFTSPKINGDK